MLTERATVPAKEPGPVYVAVRRAPPQDLLQGRKTPPAAEDIAR